MNVTQEFVSATQPKSNLFKIKIIKYYQQHYLAQIVYLKLTHTLDVPNSIFKIYLCIWGLFGTYNFTLIIVHV